MISHIKHNVSVIEKQKWKAEIGIIDIRHDYNHTSRCFPELDNDLHTTDHDDDVKTALMMVKT